MYDEVITFLEENNAEFEQFEHEPAITSKEADKLLGRSPSEGVKALLLTSGGKYILCAVKGTNKLDSKKVRAHLGQRKLRFASPEQVKEQMNVEIGACYPIGQLASVPMIVDHTLDENEHVIFSPGNHTHHVRMSWREYKRIIDPELVDITVS